MASQAAPRPGPDARPVPAAVLTSLPVLRRVAAAAPLVLCVTACGGGASTSGPSGPVPLYELVAVVFYDENGNGTADPGELVHVPDVELQVGTRSARSESSGRTIITGVPAGQATVGVRAQTLPPASTVGEWVTRDGFS